ncbi:MAG: pyrroline-5-carboxylate reductase [Pseudomonadota bacterium]
MQSELIQSALKIAFIGGGNMAQALIGGLAGKLVPANQLHVVDVMPSTLATTATRRRRHYQAFYTFAAHPIDCCGYSRGRYISLAGWASAHCAHHAKHTRVD